MNNTDTIRLGKLIERVTATATKNPLALDRLETALNMECAALTTLSGAELNTATDALIAKMGNESRQEAADSVAEIEREWERVRPTLSAVQLASLRALEGDVPVRLAMRWRLITATRARGQDVRAVGGIG
jgi:hypothetical protein